MPIVANGLMSGLRLLGANTLYRLAPLVIAALVAFAVVPLLSKFSPAQLAWPDPSVWRVLRFTVMQATLSTLLSVVPGSFAARALVSHRFAGRSFLMSLLGVPQALPAIVAVIAITSLFGANGPLGGVFPLYGLSSILLAHVFFNLPLATRLFAQAYTAIPEESLRLGQQLALPPLAHFRLVEWPQLRATFFNAMFLVFMLCAASFVIVLTLGGGPQATTLEVAIYQSLRLDFDLARALSLAALQIVFSLTLLLALRIFLVPEKSTPALRLNRLMPLPISPFIAVLGWAALLAAFMLVVPILASVIFNGIGALQISKALLAATATSALIGGCAALVALALAYGLALMRQSTVAASLAALGLVIPPALLATGWFILLIPLAPGQQMLMVLIILLNALMALPFAYSILAPAIARHRIESSRLAQSLNIEGWNRFRLVEWPALRGTFGQAGLIAFVMSLGDLAALLLLGNQGIVTLPGLIHAQMGRYQFDAAASTALCLAMLCLAFTWLAEQLKETK
jgi:thiamine transport system permease protein